MVLEHNIDDLKERVKEQQILIFTLSRRIEELEGKPETFWKVKLNVAELKRRIKEKDKAIKRLKNKIKNLNN